MYAVEQLLRRLAKVQALRARAGTPGERRAAEEAEERILARLRAMAGRGFRDYRDAPFEEPAILHRFSIRDPWTRRLFYALLERDGFEAIRYPRQQAHTIRVRAPEAAMERLWHEFRGISARLRRELEEVTDRAIRTSLFAEEARAARPR
jgi:hypothetical protein